MLAWEQVHRKPVYWMGGVRRRDGASSIRAFMRNCRNLRHQESRSSASTQDPEYRCDAAGADRFVVAVTVL